MEIHRGQSVAKEDRPCDGEDQGKTGEAYMYACYRRVVVVTVTVGLNQRIYRTRYLRVTTFWMLTIMYQALC